MFDEIASTIIALHQHGLVEKVGRQGDGNCRLGNHVISKSSPFMNSLNERIKNIDLCDPDSAATWVILQVVNIVGLKSEPSGKQLKGLLQQALERIKEVGSDITGLLLSLSARDAASLAFDEAFPILDTNAESLLSDVAFLEGLEIYLSTLSMYSTYYSFCLTARSESLVEPLEAFSHNLERNLAYPSHIIRKTSLQILKQVSPHLSSSLHDLVEAMLEIENTARTVDKIRDTSLTMRKLPALSTVETDAFLIAFCFGLLTINFAPLWNDACAVLKTVADRSGAKLWERAFSDLNSEDGRQVDATPSKGDKPTIMELTSTVWEENQLDLEFRREALHKKVLFLSLIPRFQVNEIRNLERIYRNVVHLRDHKLSESSSKSPISPNNIPAISSRSSSPSNLLLPPHQRTGSAKTAYPSSPFSPNSSTQKPSTKLPKSAQRFTLFSTTAIKTSNSLPSTPS
jgi:hypothetical protein